MGWEKEKCGNCRFWFPVQQVGPVEIGGEKQQGQCRRSPPAATSLVDQVGNLVATVSNYPMLPRRNPACAEFGSLLQDSRNNGRLALPLEEKHE